VLRSHLGPIQGEHQAHPWQPRLRAQRGLSLLRVLRPRCRRPAQGLLLLRPWILALVALNSVCKQIGGCGRGSAELERLKRDLATNLARRCTLVYVHDPLFSARRDANSLKVTHIYEVLYAAGVDVVLSGDYHNYQRFEPQDTGGNVDYERGIRQFVVGTGGKDHYAIVSPHRKPQGIQRQHLRCVEAES
jgi:hypothetical protein